MSFRQEYILINNYDTINKGDDMGIDIEHKFIDLEFLDKNSIERNRIILKNIFLIDFDNLETLFSKCIDYKWNAKYRDEAIKKSIIEDKNEVQSKNEEGKIQVSLIRYDNRKVLKEYEKFKHKEAKEIFERISFKKNIEEILKELHKITLNIMEEYKTPINEYFDINIDIDISTYNNILETYILENLKNNIYMYAEYRNRYCSEYIEREDRKREEELSLKSKELTQKEAINQYIYEMLNEENKDRFFENKETNQDMTEENVIENKSGNLSDNKKYMKNNSYAWGKIEEIILNKENGRIKSFLSNNYIYILNNYLNNRLLYKIKEATECEEKLQQPKNKNETNALKKLKREKRIHNKNLKAHTTEKLIEYADSFINNKVQFYDLYWFERLNNIDFIFNLSYLIDNRINNISIYEKNSLIESMFYIIYLPNIFANDMIMHLFLNIYTEGKYIKRQAEFEKAVKNLCSNISFFTIPLYNMIFSNVLYEYCKVKQVDISKFVDRVYKKKNIDAIKIKYRNLTKIDFLKTTKDMIQQLSVILNQWLDFDLFDRSNLIMNEIKPRIELKEIYYDEEARHIYKNKLKKFFLDITCINI